MTSAVTTQQDFVRVEDDGSESSATLGTTNADFTETVDNIFRLRFRLNTTGKDETDGYKLYQNYNAGGYAEITPSSTEVQMASSIEDGWTITNGDATTERISGPDTFVAGEYNEDGQTVSMTIAVGEETELEFCIQLIGDDLVDANTILFEVRFDNGLSLDGYTNRPTVTIDKPAAGTAVPQATHGWRNRQLSNIYRM